MRLTVGPLPSAVYWRRRAVVLGVLLAIVAMVYAGCSANSGADSKKTSGSSSPSPTPPPVDTTDASEPPALTPETGAPPGGDVPVGGGDAPGGDVPGGGAPAGGDQGGAGATGAGAPPQAPPDQRPCTDDEITLTPVPAKATIAYKTPMDVRLIIQNSSGRSCTRDVGADLQELRIVQGAAMIWSSDHCGVQKGSDVRTLSPGTKLEFGITWNGRSSSKCAAGTPTGVFAEAGQYQLLGRLGTKNSAPVALTIR